MSNTHHKSNTNASKVVRKKTCIVAFLLFLANQACQAMPEKLKPDLARQILEMNQGHNQRIPSLLFFFLATLS